MQLFFTVSKFLFIFLIKLFLIISKPGTVLTEWILSLRCRQTEPGDFNKIVWWEDRKHARAHTQTHSLYLTLSLTQSYHSLFLSLIHTQTDASSVVWRIIKYQHSSLACCKRRLNIGLNGVRGRKWPLARRSLNNRRVDVASKQLYQTLLH